MPTIENGDAHYEKKTERVLAIIAGCSVAYPYET